MNCEEYKIAKEKADKDNLSLEFIRSLVIKPCPKCE